MSGKGSIPVIASMSLSSVLYVRNLENNLLSIARITIDLNCRRIFYSHYCCFLDLVTGKMIGSGSLKDGLYFLDLRVKQPGWLKHAYHIARSRDSMAIIWLWHCRLGHPSFTLLQNLFPLFS